MQPEQAALLRSLLVEQRVLSLAVVADDRPVIGLLPFALSGDSRALIIHASRLARHTAGLAEGARFDALVHEPIIGDVDPLQVRRVTLRGEVRAFAQDDAARAADRATYLAKFPEAEPITQLGDFAFFRLEITGGRLVSGFGGAVNLTARTLPSLLAIGTPAAGDFPTN
jgi:heme oxygenase (biliverdin-IX-beta and delta-forming)